MAVTEGEVLTPRESEMVELSDKELVKRLFELVGEIEVVDDMQRDELYWLLDEAFERWTPGAAWAERVANARSQQFDDAELARELEDSIERMRDRWNARITRQALRA